MNKLKKLIGVILCALLVTGCELKYEGQVEITSDGKMDMSIIMAYDRELVSTLIYMEENDDLLGSENGDDTDIPEASITNIRTFLEKNKPEEQEGIEVSRYEKNGYYGYQMTYEIENIDDVSTKEKLYTTLFEDLIQDNENNSSNSQKKMMFQKDGDIYSANIKLNETSDNNINANLSMVGLSLKYTVTLPTKPIEHNADTVSDDGKTLSWNISSLSEKNDSIEYSFKLKDAVATAKTEGLNTEMIMLIAGIVIIVIIIVIVLVLFARNNKIIEVIMKEMQEKCPDAIDLIGIGGSFCNGDIYEKSDLDLVIIYNNGRAKCLDRCFIIDDVGFDVYTQDWSRFETMAEYNHPYVTKLFDLNIVYSRSEEVLQKYKLYQNRVKSNMGNTVLVNKHIGEHFSIKC